jgi:hypothetical protein
MNNKGIAMPGKFMKFCNCNFGISFKPFPKGFLFTIIRVSLETKPIIEDHNGAILNIIGYEV